MIELGQGPQNKGKDKKEDPAAPKAAQFGLASFVHEGLVIESPDLRRAALNRGEIGATQG